MDQSRQKGRVEKLDTTTTDSLAKLNLPLNPSTSKIKNDTESMRKIKEFNINLDSKGPVFKSSLQASLMKPRISDRESAKKQHGSASEMPLQQDVRKGSSVASRENTTLVLESARMRMDEKNKARVDTNKMKSAGHHAFEDNHHRTKSVRGERHHSRDELLDGLCTDKNENVKNYHARLHNSDLRAGPTAYKSTFLSSVRPVAVQTHGTSKKIVYTIEQLRRLACIYSLYFTFTFYVG